MQTSGKVLGKVHQLEKHHLLCQPTIRRLEKEDVVVVEMYVVWVVWLVVGGWWCFENVVLDMVFGTCCFKLIVYCSAKDLFFFEGATLGSCFVFQSTTKKKTVKM